MNLYNLWHSSQVFRLRLAAKRTHRRSVDRIDAIVETVAGEKRTIFLSFSGLLNRYASGEVDYNQLFAPNALFMFGCIREYFLGELGAIRELEWPFSVWRIAEEEGVPEEEVEQIAHQRSQRIYDIIAQAVYIAEQDGRVIWRGRGENPNYDNLNQLLELNGLRPLDLENVDTWHGFSLPATREEFRRQRRWVKAIY